MYGFTFLVDAELSHISFWQIILMTQSRQFSLCLLLLLAALTENLRIYFGVIEVIGEPHDSTCIQYMQYIRA